MSLIYDFLPIFPEILVLGMALLILMVGVFSKHSRISYYLSQITVLASAGLTWLIYLNLNPVDPIFLMNETFIFDRMSVVLDMFIYLSVFFTFLYSDQYNRQSKIPSHEFYVLGLLSLLGMQIVVSSYSLLTLFLGVELLALPTYAMVAMRRDQTRCIEAAMKYFIIGTLATGLLLYGMSMVFGATRSLELFRITQTLAVTSLGHHSILVFGLIFLIGGTAFKLGAAPFHMWVPDVYEGAPTSVTTFISTAPKLAGFALLTRLLINALPALHIQWQEMLMVIAVLSMAIGNVAAIVQSNIKRMLAYSSIAHMGYMLLGILCGTHAGFAASMFYIITYSIMALGAFGMLILMSHSGVDVEHIDDFAGLNERNPWLAFMMLLILFSLAGLPPLVGFMAKVGVLEALIDVQQVWLAVIAVLFAIIGSYYYIRVIKVMYFESAPERPSLDTSLPVKIAISINGLAVLYLGIFPGWLYSLSHFAF